MKLFKIQVLASWIVCAVCALVIIAAQTGHWFTIQHVSCRLNQNDCPDFVLAEVKKMIGVSIFGQWRQVPERIPVLLPSYRLSKTNIDWPSTVEVSFQTLPVSYGVKFQDSPVLYVDQLGVITESPSDSQKANLKIAELAENLYGPLQLRTALPASLHTALSLLFHHQQFEAQKMAVDVLSANEIRVKTASGRLYLVDSDQIGKDISQLIYLEKAFSQQDLPAAAANPKEIDLRFKYPVLRSNTE